MLQLRQGDGLTHWLRVISIVLFVLSFTIGGPHDLFAQQQDLTVKIGGFQADSWSKARVVVTVLNSEGKPVVGLHSQDFRTEINGLSIPATGLARGVDSDLPVAVVLALDVSAGMQGGALDQAKAAAHQFVDGLGPQDIVAIVVFNDTANLAQPFTQDRALAHAAIDGLAASGSAALYQAATQSVLLAAASADTGRRAVVLLSEAADNGSPDLRQQSLVAAKGLGVPVYAIGLGDSIDREYLRAIADAGGGELTETAAPEGLGQLYRDVGELLRDQYVLTLDASSLGLQPSDAATLAVTATVDGTSSSDQRTVCPQRLCVRLDILSGEKLTEARTVTADVVSAETITLVTFYLDDQQVATATQAPYTFTFDPAQFSGGEHTLAAEVASASGSTRSGDVQIRLGGGSSSGGSFTTIGAMLAIGIVALLFIAFFFLRRRGGKEGPRPAAPPDTPKAGPTGRPRGRLRLLERESEEAPLPAAAPAALLGRLAVLRGPLAGETFAIGRAPVSIGSGHRCLIRLPSELQEGGEIAPEFARLWIRDDHLMVHELRRLTVSGPVGGSWEMLEDGDVFSIGPCSFRFELGAEKKAEPAEPAEPVPDILRARLPRLEVPPQAEHPDFAEAPANILKDPPSNGQGQGPEESPWEGPPQAAAAP